MAIRAQSYPLSRRNNYLATSAPTVNDDSTKGYAKGSRWTNNTTQIDYHCVDPSSGAAVWLAKANSVVGSWTATLSYSTPGTSSFSIATNDCSYIRNGELIFAPFNLVFTPTKGTGAGALTIGGLPFTAASAEGASGALNNINQRFTWPAGYTQVAPRLLSTTTMGIALLGSAVNRISMQAADMADAASTSLVGVIMYRRA